MKKKLKLTDFKVESFVTGLDANINTKDYVGGQYTLPEPGSGVCIECVVTDAINYSLECCYESLEPCLDTSQLGCGATGTRECNNTFTQICQNHTSHFGCV